MCYLAIEWGLRCTQCDLDANAMLEEAAAFPEGEEEDTSEIIDLAFKLLSAGILSNQPLYLHKYPKYY